MQTLRFTLFAFLAFTLTSCSIATYKKTVDHVDLDKFMGTWYVLAGRFTFFEDGAHNSIEKYTWNAEKQRIDIDFTFNKDSVAGELKSIPQKAWIENKNTNAHWKVSPFWPLKFDYLVVELSADYSWTAIGVPDQKYLWIMARTWKNADAIINSATQSLKLKGYNTDNLTVIKHQY